jgi:hypothetical protein
MPNLDVIKSSLPAGSKFRKSARARKIREGSAVTGNGGAQGASASQGR